MKKDTNKNNLMQKFEYFAYDTSQLRSTRGGCCGSGDGGQIPPPNSSKPPKNTQASNGS